MKLLMKDRLCYGVTDMTVSTAMKKWDGTGSIY